jgi:hypothetical protein
MCEEAEWAKLTIIVLIGQLSGGKRDFSFSKVIIF